MSLFCLSNGLLRAERPTSHEASREALGALQSRINGLREELNQAEGARREAADELKASEQAISGANRRLRELAAERQRAQDALGRMKSEAAAVEARLTDGEARLGRVLRGHYRAGEADALRNLLSGGDPNQVNRDVHYQRLLSRAQLRLIQDQRQLLAQHRALADQQASELQRLQDLETEAVQARKQLQDEGRRRREVLEGLSSQLKQERRQLATLQRDEQRLSKLIAGLARIVATPVPRPPASASHGSAAHPPASAPSADPPPSAESEPAVPYHPPGAPFASLKGRLAMPARGELARRFGTPGVEGGPPTRGVFIRAAEGEVRAVAAGRVVFADWLRGFGNLIIVDHGDGYLSVYGNNEALLKGIGDAVNAGDSIASVGNSGGASESGLYFELRHQGQALDPAKWVVRQGH